MSKPINTEKKQLFVQQKDPNLLLLVPVLQILRGS